MHFISQFFWSLSPLLPKELPIPSVVELFLNLTHLAYLYYSSGQRNNKGYKAVGQCQEAFNKLHHNSKSPSYACGWGGYAYVSHGQHTKILHREKHAIIRHLVSFLLS